MNSDPPSLEEIFSQAVDLHGPERARYLDQACAGEPDLRARVEALLGADEVSAEFMLTPPSPMSSESLGGQRVGAYTIDRQIGSGGMADVYLAHRSDGSFERSVAVKLLKPHVATESLNRRFATERQVLALLQHPSIAQLLDGGAIDGGRSFLVMEYVDGEPIDVYCESHALSVEDRLQLFLEVCEAVRYAHASLVVHRDLKPSNILVDATGAVKLLDFGIAKVLSEDIDLDLTRTIERALTPRFASPEQFRGDVITVVSDVYSLGVLLYLILAGHHPYESDGKSAAEFERAVTTTTPPPPSRRVRESTDATTRPGAAGLIRKLRGDLDTIVMMAMRKEPDRRYASVESFAEDIQRHLDGLPVSACADTPGYRLGKFVRRNRVAVGATVVVFIALLTAAIVSTSLFFTTREARDVARVALAEASVQRSTAEETADFLKELIASIDPLVRQSNEPITVEELLEGAEEKIEEELDTQPQVAASLYGALGVSRRQMGQYDRAIADFEASLRWKMVAGDTGSVDVLQTRIQLAQARILAGDHDRAREILESVQGGLDATTDVPIEVEAELNRLRGDVEAQAGNHEASVVLLEKAIQLRRSIGADGSSDLSRDLSVLGLTQIRRANFSQARVALQEALDLLLQQHGPDHSLVGQAHNNLGYLGLQEESFDEAARHLENAVRIHSAIHEANHPSLLSARGNLARAYQAAGRLDEAEAMMIEIGEGFRTTVGEDHQNYGHSVHNLAFFVLDRGDSDRASTLFEQATEIYVNALGAEHPYVAVAKFNHARALQSAGRFESAERICRESYELRRRSLRENHPDIARSGVLLGELLNRRGAFDLAESILREAIRIRVAERGDRHSSTAWSRLLLGESLLGLDRDAEALGFLRVSHAVIDSIEGVDSDRTRRAALALQQAEVAEQD